jgi:formylglycine-generating enzyme required for sulfatase activity
MQLVNKLVGFGLRAALGEAGGSVADLVEQRCTDHGQALPHALTHANERAWQTLALALAGDGFVDQVKSLVASADVKGLRKQIERFLQRNAAFFDQTDTAYRKSCLAELSKAREQGLLNIDLTPTQLGQEAACFPYYADSQALMKAGEHAVAAVADALAPTCPHLSRLLRQPTPSGPPLLVAAFAFYFRREIETNQQLSNGLTFESLRRLSADQAQAFAEVGDALHSLGDHFDVVLVQLGQVATTVTATHEVVLDIHADLEEMRRLVKEAMARIDTGSEPGTSRLSSLRSRGAPRTGRLLFPPPPRRAGSVFTSSVGMRLAWIAPGKFLMGSPPREIQRREDEPQHGVTLTRGFFLAIHPVTQAQWKAVMGSNPSRFRGEANPVENVSWDDCIEFCARLTRKDGPVYRLPTEAEWEYACRAGTAGAFHTGAMLSTDQANFDGRDVYASEAPGTFRGETTPGGHFAANAWSLHDMHGNVHEWCADWYGDYPPEHVTDPLGPPLGDARVLRGGSWLSAPWYCRCASRYWTDPAATAAHIGCRVCFNPADEEV